MKYLHLITAGFLLLASSLAYSGAENSVPVRVLLNDDGSGAAFGDMLSARADKNSKYGDDVFIGCGVRAFDDGVGGTFRQIFCQATGPAADPMTFEPLDTDTAVTAQCFSESEYLFESLKMIDSYSFVTFAFDDTGTCTRIGISTQSFYLPKTKGNKP